MAKNAKNDKRESIKDLYDLLHSQKEVAKRLKISQSKVSRILSGKTKEVKISSKNLNNVKKSLLRKDKFLSQIQIRFKTKANEKDKYKIKYIKSDLFAYSPKLREKIENDLVQKLFNNIDYNDILIIDKIKLVRYGVSKKAGVKLWRL